MKVAPKTEKEIVELNLLPKGWYPFTIAKAEEKLSKKGNEMIEVNLKVYRDNGFSFVRDWLMDTDLGAGKLRHCAETCGVLKDYESGELDADSLIEKEGYVKIGVQKGQNGYADQNNILDYSKTKPEEKGKTGDALDPDLDGESEIPF